MGFEKVFEKVRGDIERVGWSAIGVFPTVDDDRTVRFTYTIGLTEMDHPELIIYGLPAEQAHGVLYSAIENIREGVSFQAGERYPNVLADFDVEVRETDEDDQMNVARSYYEQQGRTIETLQMLWPDGQGLFPGEPGVDPMTAILQVPQGSIPHP